MSQPDLRGILRWQKVEGALIAIIAVGVALAMGVGLPWWLAVLVFFAPGLSFVGYIAGPKVGAVGYNLLHIYAFGPIVFLLGLVGLLPPLAVPLGLLWLGHAGFDRMLGYGLKSGEGFEVTHLGPIGQSAKRLR